MHGIILKWWMIKLFKTISFCAISLEISSPMWISLRWRHNDHYSVSNHQPHGCLLNCLFRRRWKKTSKLRVTGLCVGNSPGPVNSPHKGPVTRKMFPFDDVIMCTTRLAVTTNRYAMMTTLKPFSHYWPVCEGIPPVTAAIPHQGSVMRSFDVFLYYSDEAGEQKRVFGDLRRHYSHVTCTSLWCIWI